MRESGALFYRRALPTPLGIARALVKSLMSHCNRLSGRVLFNSARRSRDLDDLLGGLLGGEDEALDGELSEEVKVAPVHDGSSDNVLLLDGARFPL